MPERGFIDWRDIRADADGRAPESVQSYQAARGERWTPPRGDDRHLNRDAPDA
jgi:hypothetical protein